MTSTSQQACQRLGPTRRLSEPSRYSVEEHQEAPELKQVKVDVGSTYPIGRVPSAVRMKPPPHGWSLVTARGRREPRLSAARGVGGCQSAGVETSSPFGGRQR